MRISGNEPLSVILCQKVVSKVENVDPNMPKEAEANRDFHITGSLGSTITVSAYFPDNPRMSHYGMVLMICKKPPGFIISVISLQ